MLYFMTIEYGELGAVLSTNSKKIQLSDAYLDVMTYTGDMIVGSLYFLLKLHYSYGLLQACEVSIACLAN